MMGSIKTLLGSLLGSKKFVTAIVAALVWVLGRFGLNMETSDLLPIVGALVSFVLAQGWADSGKEAAKVASDTNKAMKVAELLAGDGSVDGRKKAADSLAPPIAG